MKRANPNDRLLAKALANGAVVLGEVPKRLQPKPPKPRREGEYTNRLEACALLGWHWIETDDAERYRWRTSAGHASPWGTYEDVTLIKVGPAR